VVRHSDTDSYGDPHSYSNTNGNRHSDTNPGADRNIPRGMRADVDNWILFRGPSNLHERLPDPDLIAVCNGQPDR
jgi:hypothetical protein